MKLMADLRETYNRCDSSDLRASPVMGEETIMENEMTGQEDEEKGGSSKSLSQVLPVPSVSSEEELIDGYLDEYEKFVSSSAEEINVSDIDIDILML